MAQRKSPSYPEWPVDRSVYSLFCGDYCPSSESDSGDEIAPSPRKKSKVKFSRKQSQGPKTSRSLFVEEADSEDDIPLAQVRDAIRAKECEEDEDDLIRCLEEPMWANIPYENPEATFGGSEEIVDELKEPISYFRELITDEVMEAMAEQTNLYSVQKDGKSIDTSKAEIDLFIGLYLRMGLMQAYAVRAFWAEETRWERVADFMPRHRFEKLSSTIHFIDNMGVTEEDKKDRLHKLRPWLKSLSSSLSKLPQEEFSAVDEIMIPFKGRSGIKQYMRNKPHKWGFKLWGRAGASGTLLEFEVYQGAGNQQSEGSHSQLSKTTETVLRMTSNVPERKNYKVFADNLFTSLPLVNILKERGIFYTGTVRMNRLKGCSLSSEADLKKTGRGSLDYKVEVNSGIVAVRWYDNRTVDLVSLTALYRFPIKSKRWYMYVFFYTTNMMVVNAWLRYRKHAQVMKRRPMRLAEFQGRLATQLVSPKAPVGRPRIYSPPHRQSKVHHRSAPPREIRLDGHNHLPEWSQSRERCKAEDCSSLSYIKCAKCNVHLCLNKDRNCFARFHTA